MASSSSRRARRDERRRNKQRSRSSTSRTSYDSDSSAPTYAVEENSKGELVNKRLGVRWPTRVDRVKRYPHHSSASSLGSSSEGNDQFASSPYEMIAIADLEAAAAAAAAAACRRSRSRTRASDRRASYVRYSSPEYDDHLSGARSNTATDARLFVPGPADSDDDDRAGGDETTAPIDSVVFDSAEQLDRYQELFRDEFFEVRRFHDATSNDVALGSDEDTLRHYMGVKSREEIEDKLKPGLFFIYYDKASCSIISLAIDLRIGYMTSSAKIYHFPIQRFKCEGEPYFLVMQTAMDVKVFPSLAELVQYYRTFSLMDPVLGCIDPES